jgi:predicted DNA-binding helix-hairpin-helix protein
LEPKRNLKNIQTEFPIDVNQAEACTAVGLNYPGKGLKAVKKTEDRRRGTQRKKQHA